jgi:hypothetical protein
MRLQAGSTAPYYLYELRVEISATDAAVLVDAIEGEPLGLRTRIGAAEIERQIRELELSVAARSDARWDDFEKDLEILSVYLAQDIVGLEVHVTPGASGDAVEAYRIVGHRGETARLRLDLAPDPKTGELTGAENLAELARRWPTLPEWIRSAMRNKHPTLAAS